MSQQNALIKKYKFFFSNKNSPNSLYLIIICKLTHLGDINAKIKFMLRILEKFMQDPNTDPKPAEQYDPDPKKK